MQIHELTKEQYLGTTDKMVNITDAHESLVDIWQYAKELNNQNLLSKHMFKNRMIEAVYRNVQNSFHHVLLFGKEKNVYLVIIVDVQKSDILGHY